MLQLISCRYEQNVLGCSAVVHLCHMTVEPEVEVNYFPSLASLFLVVPLSLCCHGNCADISSNI